MNRSIDQVVAPGASEEPQPDALSKPTDRTVADFLVVIRRAIRRTWQQAPESTIDDIAQEACMKVVQALKSGPRPKQLAAFLYRVGANAALDALRKVQRRRETHWVEAAADCAQPDQRAETEHLMGQVEAALVTLLEDRQIAVRFYLLGYRPADTAAITGWSIHRTRNLVYRGLRDLRRTLARQGVEYEDR